MSIKQLVNQYDIYQAFKDHLAGKISLLHKSLESASDPVEVYRLQGQIIALRRLQMLREEILATEK